MPKVKVARKSTTIDMTAMCDVAFLLLTFFMLTTKFKPDEAVIVDTPASISEIKLPDSDIMTLTLTRDGKVFFGIDGKFNREKLLQKIADKYQINFTPDEVKSFSLTSSFGVPIGKLKDFLNMTPDERNKPGIQPGIPIDSTNNELGIWVMQSRLTNPNFRIAVKGDEATNFPVVKKVFNTLQDKNVNKFNLVTDLKVRPKT